MKKLLFCMAVGAALMYFLDGTSGSWRRQIVRQKLERQGWISPVTQSAPLSEAPAEAPGYAAMAATP